MNRKSYIYSNVNLLLVSDKVHEQYNDEQQLSSIKGDQLNQDAFAMLVDHKIRWH